MSTKKLIYLFLIVLSVCSCDQIDENSRYIEVPAVEATKCLLLVDFTGQDCVNCPLATKVNESLAEEYKKNFVSVAMHTGPYSLPELRFSGGAEYIKTFEVETYPTALIDGLGVSDVYENWSTSVRELIQRKSYVEMSIESSYDESTRELTVTPKVKALADLPNVKLQLWVTENGIVAKQKLPDSSTDYNYVHNHVLRAAINGNRGESIETTNGEEKTYAPVKSVLNAKWKVENMEIVGFVYIANTNEVLQTVKVEIISKK